MKIPIAALGVKSKDWWKRSNRASTIREKRLVTKYFYEHADCFYPVIVSRGDWLGKSSNIKFASIGNSMMCSDIWHKYHE